MEDSRSGELGAVFSTSQTRFLYDENNLPAFADVEELRWKTLLDCDGEKIGTIEAIEVDELRGRVEFMEVGRGGFLGFGAERFLVPVTRIVQVEEKSVRIDRRLRQLGGVPPYRPDRLSDQDYCEEVRTWWYALDSLPDGESAAVTPGSDK